MPTLSHAKQQQLSSHVTPQPALRQLRGILLRSGYTYDLSRFLHGIIPVASRAIAVPLPNVLAVASAVAVDVASVAKIVVVAFTVPLTARGRGGRGRERSNTARAAKLP